jgi:hypothetical protein
VLVERDSGRHGRAEGTNSVRDPGRSLELEERTVAELYPLSMGPPTLYPVQTIPLSGHSYTLLRELCRGNTHRNL